ncbi:MAG: glutamate racemase [bacterium]|nr:glutamate racemase [bacterium]
MDKAIGIFDSGVGGLTVMKEVIKELPFEDIIYFGDIARTPYGSKSKETVTKYAREIVHFLSSQGVKIIVVACNTVTSFALETLRQEFRLPIIGVIKPGVKKAVEIAGNKRVGVIGTEGTILSGAYQREIKSIQPSVEIISISCPLFVPIVEEGWIDTEVSNLVASEYLAPLKTKKIDTLILGCTHYPMLKKVIQKVIGDGVKLVDSATQVAIETKDVLSKNGLIRESNRKATHKFYVSDLPPKFKELAKRFLGEEIREVIKIDMSEFVK